MPFKSEAQRRYLWANEPEIARDWTDTYGSRIQKRRGGIMGSNAGSMLVAPTRDGSRPGYGGPQDWGQEEKGTGAYSSGTTSSNDDNRDRESRRSQQYIVPKKYEDVTIHGQQGPVPTYKRKTYSPPYYQPPTFRDRMGGLGNAMVGGIFSLINPLAGLAFKGYNYFKDQVPRAFSNFKSTNTLEEFRDKMRGYGKTIPTYSNNPAFGGIESLGTGFKSFIDPNKTISSEDIGSILERIKSTTGYDTTLAKTYGLDELLKSKAAEEGFAYGHNLTDQGKALERFRKDATGMNNPSNPNMPYKGLGVQFQLDQLLRNENENAMRNKDYIQQQINEGFLEDNQDFIDQKPLGDLI